MSSTTQYSSTRSSALPAEPVSSETSAELTPMQRDWRSFIQESSRWCENLTSVEESARKPEQDARLSFSGRRLSRQGGSGARVDLVAMKTHSSAWEEGHYCRYLGSGIAPRVYMIEPEAYVMEYLEPARRYPGLLTEMESALIKHVWSSNLWFTQRDSEWPRHLLKRTGLQPPELVRTGYSVCKTHGDCTASNAMRRESGDIVIGDPIFPRPHVARCAEADMGRLLQSALGWESVAYGERPVEWTMPQFWMTEYVKRRALWWCGATARRIAVDWENRGQLTPEVKTWCERTEETCFSAADL